MIYAGFLQRIGGALIDSLIFLFAFVALAGNNQDDPTAMIIYFFLFLILTLLLVAFLTVRYSGTPGNLLTNCQIVDAITGNSVTWKQSLRRSIGLLWTMISGGLGLLLIIFDRQKRALHDRVAGTVVVFSGTIDRFDESQKSLRQLLSEVR